MAELLVRLVIALHVQESVSSPILILRHREDALPTLAAAAVVPDDVVVTAGKVK